MIKPLLSLARILPTIAVVLGFTHAATGAVTLEFSSPANEGLATNFSNAAGAAGVDGMRWGIIVDTNGDGFKDGLYDGEFNINTAGFLTFNGGNTSDDYYVPHPGQSVTFTSTATPQDPGGAGTIGFINDVPVGGASTISEGDAFILVWFPTTTATGASYGTLGNASNPNAFVIPADGATQSFNAHFLGADAIKPASHVLISPIPGPEIVVQQPAGSPLTNGGTLDYGTVAKGGTKVKVFRIHNGGNANLTGVSASLVSGSDSSYTIVGTAPSATVAPGGETFVSVQIAPTTLSTKTVTLRIASNDGDENPFEVNLTGLAIAETVVPTLTLASPIAGANVLTGNTITISGSASDNNGVDSVKVKLNTSATVDAVLANPGGTTTTWSLDVVPIEGANSVSVRAVDTTGLGSTPMVRNFTISRKLEVAILPADGGTVTAGLGTVASVFSPESNREVGKSYTLVATPKPGFIFKDWTVTGFTPAQYGQLGIVASALEKSTLTFIFRRDLKLTANFVNNPYDDPGVAGNYNGLVHASTVPADNSFPGLGTEGYLTATVLNTGGFSGRLTIDGFVLNVAGIFDHQGRARFGTARAHTLTVPRTNKPSLVVKFDIGGAPGSVVPTVGLITGTVEAKQFLSSAVPISVSIATARRAHFTGLAGFVVPDEYLTVTGTAPSPTGRTDGVFTVVLPSVPVGSQPLRVSSVLTEQDYPKGNGVGSLRISKAGAVTLTGTLADGTPITAFGTLSADLDLSLFAQLYTQKGFLSAPVKLNHLEVDSDLKEAVGEDVLWCRPFNPTVHYYPYGWAETIELDLLGAKYVVAGSQTVMKAPDGPDGGNAGDALQLADEDGNVTLTFTHGLISELDGLTKFANVSPGPAAIETVAKVPSNDPTFTMVVTRASGMVTGIFEHTDDTKPSYSAVVFQKGPNAGAYGFFLTKQPKPIDYTGESGVVTIVGQPAVP
jgi:hypothetical protein